MLHLRLSGASSAFLLLLALTACSTKPITPTPDGGGGACATGKLSCLGTCVDTTTDPKNCGACGTTCGRDSICSAGACVLTCVPPQLACGGACVDVTTSHEHCGACGTACEPKQVCSKGACAETCPADQVKCGSICIDPTTDLQQCGATAGCGVEAGSAGAACVGGQRCTGGVCTCPPSWLFCNGACVDPAQDRNRCGATACNDGVVCGVNEVCAAGACALTCPAGLLKCDGTCINPYTDLEHCGATNACDVASGTAGTACASGQVCSSGSCALYCQTGMVKCNGVCVDPNADRLFCGATPGCGAGAGDVGTACGAGQVCNSGTCAVSCLPGMLNCDGACVDPASDRARCGAKGDCTDVGAGNSAGIVCAAGNLCVAGACAISCPSGSVNCGGACINPHTDNGYCGAAGDCTNVGAANSAGSACTQGMVCNGWVCAVVCQPGFVNCGGICTDPSTSRAHCGAAGNCTNAGTGNSAGAMCAAGNLCIAGSCQVSCPAGSVNCGGKCVNPQADNTYCGAAGDCTNTGSGNSAGSLCTAGSVCAAGACALSCSGELHACSNMCVDWTYNPSHCGGCGQACSTNHISQPGCFASSCSGACDRGYSDCDGDKRTNGCEMNSGSNAANCGGCSVAGDHNCNRNASGGTCTGGFCSGATCDTGYANCDGLANNGCETVVAGVGAIGMPGAAFITNYFTMDGAADDISHGTTIPAEIGTDGTADNGNDWGLGYTTGQLNQALNLDGADDSVDLGVAVGNFGTADFSIAMWLKTTRMWRTQWILTKRAYCTHAPFWNVGITWDGRLIFEIDQDYDGTNYGNMNGTVDVTDDVWHHVAFVRQGTSLRIYVDGKLDATGVSSGVTNLMESYNARIGQISCAWGQNFGGQLDDLAIWTGYALTPADERRITCTGGR